MNLLRPLSLAVLLTLIGIYFLFQGKHRGLFMVTLIFPWVYDGFVILIIPLFCFMLAEWLIYHKINLKSILAYSAGTILGFSVNPFFPNNLLHLLNVFNLKFIEGFRADNLEWQRPNLIYLFFHSPLLAILTIMSLLMIFLIILNARSGQPYPNSAEVNKQKFNVTFWSALSLFFLIMTMLAIRFTDYLAPSLVMLAAFSLTFVINFHTVDISLLWDKVNKILHKTAVKTFIIITITALIAVPLIGVMSYYKNTSPLNRYQATALWLKNNTTEKAVIFQTAWDAFPRLYYFNSHNYYIVGLDPAFLYLADKNLYYLWRNIAEKSIACTDPTDLIDLQNLTISNCKPAQQTPQAIAQAIKTQFHSDYIWTNNYFIYRDFKKFLEANSEYFKKMIETNDSSVFKIIKLSSDN